MNRTRSFSGAPADAAARRAGRRRDLRARPRQPCRQLRPRAFGWQEAGFRTPVAVAVIAEVGAVVLLTAALTGDALPRER